MRPRNANSAWKMRAALAAMVLTLGARATAEPTPYVWWEGEDTTDTNFPQRSAFSTETFQETAHLLSEGDWLSNSGPRAGAEAYAAYDVDVPANATYDLWGRKFWKHGPFRWRFDEGPWSTCGRDVALADSTYLRTHLGANWVYLGEAELVEGSHRFELRLLADEGEQMTAAFDAFVLTPGAFLPNGRLKPGERSGLADPGYFPYEPGLDAFGAAAVLDLRTLNEDAAGEDGFVEADGDIFRLASGDEVRFWGVNVNANHAGQNRKSVDYLARKLAKLGVNIVRFHSPLFDGSGDPAKIDSGKLDDLFYLVAAMKGAGIYTEISFYFPLWFDVQPHYGIDGYDMIDNKRPFALLYFEERMQQIHREWLRQILTTPNPYTDTRLADEPAVAIVEIVNEDSFFFWTFSKENVPAIYWARLESMYAEWLAARYGSVAAAAEGWGGTLDEDDIENGRVAILEAWHMTGDGSRAGGPSKTRRVGDQVRFLTEVQRDFYVDTTRYIEQELGYGGLVTASNWHVTDGPTLDALERYTYTAADVIDRHGYFGGQHTGEGSGYSVRVGHEFQDRAGVRSPEAMPLAVAQIDGYPHTISEIGWPQPNRFRADMTFLSSAYGALQGIDAFFFFAVGSVFLADASIAKFQLGSPSVAATFPAAALMYRRGDVQESAPSVSQVIVLNDLYAMKGSGAGNPTALDALREADIPVCAAVDGAISTYDPLSFYAGPFTRRFGDSADESSQANLAAAIDREGATVESLAPGLKWDYGAGVATVDTPRSQAAAGFLGAAGMVDLTDVAIHMRNEYGSVTVTALDGADIGASDLILIQSMTEDRPYGF
ncbi:hypothetical protein HOK31_28160, partial [Candidatus Poribacteria bacterium]|nr:hypothetical protein [Candidatus Poribacteria bacterium]